MENEQANINIERRSGADRRDDSEAFDFPFIDSHGHLVTEDRRKYHRRCASTSRNTQGRDTSMSYTRSGKQFA